ncbi:hypothetical protein PFUGPA_00657 [Plasmodium falciparum Palo Alto/Uganda]|uniref:Rifin n=1 Tax=Plasmodium falciparum (isolate Palo Alto / Uganda) TaxID=57270 RepID=W4J524_PLAFP|nr:hypothetical protein PFUGPA_00657 [Plasmodium falciparum Palo Alto/Uganda]
MKILYINILLFAVPFIIMVGYPKNTYITPYTPTATSRLLCECDIYTPMYDNDPEMKAVMENYNRQTSDRFKEYDERMKTTRQKCREQCDKEIQKIILKDKLEKELMDKFATLQTDIQNDAIPTCVCEKSLADKVEKACLKCTQNLGGIVAPSLGVLGGIAEGALSVWKPVALKAATEHALTEGAAKGAAAGIEEGIKVLLNRLNTDFGLPAIDIQQMGLVFNAQNYKDAGYIYQAIFTKYQGSCMGSHAVHVPVTGTSEPICRNMIRKVISRQSRTEEAAIKSTVKAMVSDAEATAQMTTETTTKEAISTLTIEKTGEVNATYGGCQTVIIASVVAILVIVLVMIIIYLILRYRRKKKMKKKLQYIKLLEE